MPNTLPLSQLFNVAVSVSPQAPATPQFNQALIIGTSGVIPTSTRCVQFTGSTMLQQMLAYGFSPTSPEYLATQAYVSQSANGPAPNYVWIGRQDLSAMGTVTIGASGGTGYAVNDIVTVTQPGGSGGQLKVTAVTAGAVTAVALIPNAQGTGYAVANNLNTTTTGTGTGLEIDITAIGESPLQAVAACRLASYSWYLVNVLTATDADNIAISEYAQTAVPQMQNFFSTSSASVLTGAAGNIFSVLKAGNYNRYQGVYSTTQNGAAPGNAYIACALMGVAMGLNTGLPNSYFTLAYKELIGITPEPISLPQYTTLQSICGNVYVNFNNAYSWYQTGLTGTGQYFDQTLVLDMLASDLQYAEANLLAATPSVPQSDGGQTQLIHAANNACLLSVARGAIAPGIWEGQTLAVGNTFITEGTSLPNGFQCMSAPIRTQTSADRAARKAMPIIIAIILAGSMQSMSIAVYVQQ